MCTLTKKDFVNFRLSNGVTSWIVKPARFCRKEVHWAKYDLQFLIISLRLQLLAWVRMWVCFDAKKNCSQLIKLICYQTVEIGRTYSRVARNVGMWHLCNFLDKSPYTKTRNFVRTTVRLRIIVVEIERQHWIRKIITL